MRGASTAVVVAVSLAAWGACVCNGQSAWDAVSPHHEMVPAGPVGVRVGKRAPAPHVAALVEAAPAGMVAAPAGEEGGAHARKAEAVAKAKELEAAVAAAQAEVRAAEAAEKLEAAEAAKRAMLEAAAHQPPVTSPSQTRPGSQDVDKDYEIQLLKTALHTAMDEISDLKAVDASSSAHPHHRHHNPDHHHPHRAHHTDPDTFVFSVPPPPSHTHSDEAAPATLPAPADPGTQPPSTPPPSPSPPAGLDLGWNAHTPTSGTADGAAAAHAPGSSATATLTTMTPPGTACNDLLSMNVCAGETGCFWNGIRCRAIPNTMQGTPNHQPLGIWIPGKHELVRVAGLKGDATRNGMVGSIVSWHPHVGRFLVQELEEPHATFLLKQTNLRQLAPDPTPDVADTLSGNEHDNRIVGTVENLPVHQPPPPAISETLPVNATSLVESADTVGNSAVISASASLAATATATSTSTPSPSASPTTSPAAPPHDTDPATIPPVAAAATSLLNHTNTDSYPTPNPDSTTSTDTNPSTSSPPLTTTPTTAATMTTTTTTDTDHTDERPMEMECGGIDADGVAVEPFCPCGTLACSARLTGGAWQCHCNSTAGLAKDVTLIVPCIMRDLDYFEQRFLPSLASQTMRPAETILAISSVTDEQAAELRSRFASWGITVLPTITAMSAGENRNRASEVAKTSIVTFHDADDEMHPQRIEVVNAVVQDTNAACVVHSFSTTNHSMRTRFQWRDNVDTWHQLDGADFVSAILDVVKGSVDGKRRFPLQQPGQATCQTDVLKQVHFSDQMFAEDFKFNGEVGKMFGRHRMMFISLPLTVYHPSKEQLLGGYLSMLNTLEDRLTNV